MAIEKAGRRLFKYIRIPRIRKSLTNKGGRSVVASLNLTAMIDMMTVLVTFLMMLFNATGEILAADKDIRIPRAMNNLNLNRALIVQVSPFAVKFEGELIIQAADILNEKASEEDVTKPLKAKLVEKQEAFLRDPKNEGKKPPEEIIIHADSSVPYMAIKRIMMTCARNGYPRINLAVEGKSKDEAL